MNMGASPPTAEMCQPRLSADCDYDKVLSAGEAPANGVGIQNRLASLTPPNHPNHVPASAALARAGHSDIMVCSCEQRLVASCRLAIISAQIHHLEPADGGSCMIGLREAGAARAPGSKMDDTYGDNDVRVWLYVSFDTISAQLRPKGSYRLG